MYIFSGCTAKRSRSLSKRRNVSLWCHNSQWEGLVRQVSEGEILGHCCSVARGTFFTEVSESRSSSVWQKAISITTSWHEMDDLARFWAEQISMNSPFGGLRKFQSSPEQHHGKRSSESKRRWQHGGFKTLLRDHLENWGKWYQFDLRIFFKGGGNLKPTKHRNFGV